MKNTSRKIGIAKERIACEYLQQQGLILVGKNYYCKLGEIDLIMLDKNILVFIEVRYRKNSNFLHAVETIDKHKQRKIILTSQNYLQRHPKYRFLDMRFDVALVGSSHQQNCVEWIENAFTA